MDGEREKFEAWYEKHNGHKPPAALNNFDGTPSGKTYGNTPAESAWLSWQARASLPSAQPQEH